jgi:hypothetical protein
MTTLPDLHAHRREIVVVNLTKWYECRDSASHTINFQCATIAHAAPRFPCCDAYNKRIAGQSLPQFIK